MKALTFEIRSTISGTNMFAEETFKTEVTLRDLNTVTIAVACALGKFINEADLGAVRDALIVRLPSVKRGKASEILNGTTAGNKGSYRILAKEV